MKVFVRQNVIQFALNALISFVLGLLSLFLQMPPQVIQVFGIIFNGYVFIVALLLLILCLTSLIPKSKRKIIAHVALAYVFFYLGEVVHIIFLADLSVLNDF